MMTARSGFSASPFLKPLIVVLVCSQIFPASFAGIAWIGVPSASAAEGDWVSKSALSSDFGLGGDGAWIDVDRLGKAAYVGVASYGVAKDNQYPALVLARYISELYAATPASMRNTPDFMKEVESLKTRFWESYEAVPGFRDHPAVKAVVSLAQACSGGLPACKVPASALLGSLGLVGALDDFLYNKDTEAMFAGERAENLRFGRAEMATTLGQIYDQARASGDPLFISLMDTLLADVTDVSLNSSIGEMLANPYNAEILKNIPELYSLLLQKGFFPGDSKVQLSVEELKTLIEGGFQAIDERQRRLLEVMGAAPDLESTLKKVLSASEAERRGAEERARIQSEKDRIALEGLQSSFLVVGMILSNINPVAGNQVMKIGDAMVRLTEATAKFNAILTNQAFGAQEVALGSLTYVGAILTAFNVLQSLAMSHGPSAEELIFNQVVALRRQLDAVSVQLNGRFDAVDTQLSGIFSSMMVSFRSLNRQLGDIQGQLRRIRTDLTEVSQKVDQLASRVEALYREELRVEFALLRERCLAVRSDFANPALSEAEFRKCLGDFKSFATVHAKSDFAVHRSAGPMSINSPSLRGFLEEGTPASNLNFLVGAAAELGNPVSIPGGASPSDTIVNPWVWGESARGLLATISGNPGLLGVPTPELLDPVIREGELALAASQELGSVYLGGRRRLKMGYLSALLQNYESALRDYFIQIVRTLEAFNDRSFHGLDPWNPEPAMRRFRSDADVREDAARGRTDADLDSEFEARFEGKLDSLKALSTCEDSPIQLTRQVSGFSKPVSVLPESAIPVILDSSRPVSACLHAALWEEDVTTTSQAICIERSNHSDILQPDLEYATLRSEWGKASVELRTTFDGRPIFKSKVKATEAVRIRNQVQRRTVFSSKTEYESIRKSCHLMSSSKEFKKTIEAWGKLPALIGNSDEEVAAAPEKVFWASWGVLSGRIIQPEIRTYDPETRSEFDRRALVVRSRAQADDIQALHAELDLSGDLSSAARRLDGARELLRQNLMLIFPTSWAENDILHSLFAGPRALTKSAGVASALTDFDVAGKVVPSSKAFELFGAWGGLRQPELSISEWKEPSESLRGLIKALSRRSEAVESNPYLEETLTALKAQRSTMAADREAKRIGIR